jgi:hypothetical protein
LTSVSGEPADSLVDAPRESLDVTGLPDGAETDAYSFDVGAHVPTSRVNVTLPEANMMSSVELSSRRLPSDPWRYITRGNFYRIKAAEGEQHNAPLDVGIVRDRYWRARILHGGGLLRAPPELHVEWVPTEVTFLASGRAPFLLVYGNAAVAGAETDLSILPAATEIATATAGDVSDLGGARRLRAQPGKFPWVRAALWALLVLAVALLGWMALRLTKDTVR